MIQLKCICSQEQFGAGKAKMDAHTHTENNLSQCINTGSLCIITKLGILNNLHGRYAGNLSDFQLMKDKSFSVSQYYAKTETSCDSECIAHKCSAHLSNIAISFLQLFQNTNPLEHSSGTLAAYRRTGEFCEELKHISFYSHHCTETTS